MSKAQMLRSLVLQRLTSAVEEIFELLEETITECEEQQCRSEEAKGDQNLLGAVFNPEVRLHRLDTQQLLVREEVPPEQQERSSSLTHQNPAEAAHIKEEQEEVWINQEREHLQEPEEDDMRNKESDEEMEKSELLPSHENQTEENRDKEHLKADVEECGQSGSVRIFNPGVLAPTETPDKSLHIDSVDNINLCDLEEILSSFNPLENAVVMVDNSVCDLGNASPSSSESPIRFDQDEHPQENKERNSQSRSCRPKGCDQESSLSKHIQTHEGCYPCIICNQSLGSEETLVAHLKIHMKEKLQEIRNLSACVSVCPEKATETRTGAPFYPCHVCKMSFSHMKDLSQHMGVHTEQKLEGSLRQLSDGTSFSVKSDLTSSVEPQLHTCYICKTSFDRRRQLSNHMRAHTAWTCACPVCGKTMMNYALKRHMRIHTDEDCIKCSVCGKKFLQSCNLRRHMVTHTDERPFSCPLCRRRFKRRETMMHHVRIHTRKPFCCLMCGESFIFESQLQLHMNAHKQS